MASTAETTSLLKREGSHGPSSSGSSDNDIHDEENRPRTSFWGSSKPPGGKLGALRGMVSAQEGLWSVIFTMDIAALRTKTLEKGLGYLWNYALFFFIFWGVVSASINYSTRFNSQDTFHTIFWSLFLFGMALQQAYLFQDIRGFALATAFLYLLITVAYARAVYSLPGRAGIFSVVFGVQSLASTLIFGGCVLSYGNTGGFSVETFLWVQVTSGPACHIIYELLVLDAAAQSAEESAGDRMEVGMITTSFRRGIKSLGGALATSQLAWDVPVDFKYIISRYTGIANLMIICSVIFPLSLLGADFLKNTQTIAVICLANGYAIVLKTTLLDLEASAHEIHAVLRSRFHAMVWMLLAPFEFLGIALTGVGFVAGVYLAGRGSSLSLEFARTLLCVGLILTYATFAALHALHSPTPGTEKSHHAQIAVLALSCLGFLIPVLFELNLIPTVVIVVVCAVLVIGAMLAIEYGCRNHVSESWQWKQPRNHVDFDDRFKKRSHGISSSEEFFTVLLAVAIYQLNDTVSESSYSPHTFIRYVIRLLVFYTLIDATMWYSCRFGEDDASHKLMWAIVDYFLLLILEGLGGDPGGDGSLYKVAVSGLYVFIALMFYRVAYCSPRSRRFALFWGSIYALSSVFGFSAAFQPGGEVSLFIPIVAIFFVAQPIFYYGVLWMASDDWKAWDVPPNLSYIVQRFSTLPVEVLTVALIVPNAVYPGSYSHPYLVFGADLLAITMALSLKWALLDAEPVEIDSLEHHAYGREPWRAILFSKLNPLIILGVGLIGCSMHVLITESGEGGTEANTSHFQASMCAANAIFWVSVTLTKLLHKPWNEKADQTKCGLQMAAGVMSAFPFFLDSDYGVLVLSVAINAITVGGIFAVNFRVNGDLAVAKPRHALE